MALQLGSMRIVAGRAGVIYLLICCCVWFGGCDSGDANPLVPSLQPLYTAVDLDFDERFLGGWADEKDEMRFVFEPGGEKVYKLTITEGEGSDEVTAEFEAHLVRLGADWLLDLYPKQLTGGGDLYQLHFLRAHTFVRVRLKDDSLQLLFFKADWLKERLDEKSVDIPHEVTADGVLLTGTTQELQDLVYRCADDEEAFGIPIHLARSQSEESE
ncbi:MAG: hypothetical protein NVS9B13_01390 [Candidatus Acidiferrum sp.]